MDDFVIRQGPWRDGVVEGGTSPAVQDAADATRARLGIEVAGTMLTHHEDIWTERSAEEILVPHSVLADWFVGCWWRLECEPIPWSSMNRSGSPAPDWRMAHEIAGAGGGCVWPFVGFASDLREGMWVFSDVFHDPGTQSVRYTRALERPAVVAIDDFEAGVTAFVNRVVDRVRDSGCDSDLPEAWRLLCEELNHAGYSAWRKAEARLGYYPGEGPDERIEEAIELETRMGAAASAEILPAFGRDGIDQIKAIVDAAGIEAASTPFSGVAGATGLSGAPWKVGYDAARRLRREAHVPDGVLNTSRLADWLGLREADLDRAATTPERRPATIAVARPGGGFTFHLRRGNPLSRRFELARLVGDVALSPDTRDEWLAATDLATWRQRFQRAFAAELLCPAESLREFRQELENDEFATAAQRFQVSEWVVENQFSNHLCE